MSRRSGRFCSLQMRPGSPVSGLRGQKYFARTLPKTYRTGGSPILDSASKWLSIYFSGGFPSFTPPLHLIGTEFQTAVWNHLLSIPYGTTVTYSAIGKRIAASRGGTRFSAQAVGGRGGS